MTVQQSTAQQSVIKKFLQMHLPEQIWVITHPFIAKKAWTITKEAKAIADSMAHDRELDGNIAGGQVDAFRHAFWMASLVQEIHPRKARKLGIAHEKGNYIDFKKKTLEEGQLPDSVSCEMDMKNNEAGIAIGKENRDMSQEKLIGRVKNAVLSGELWVIKKDSKGNFLDWNGNIIPPEDYLGKWNNPKCLVPSNFKKK